MTNHLLACFCHLVFQLNVLPEQGICRNAAVGKFVATLHARELPLHQKRHFSLQGLGKRIVRLFTLKQAYPVKPPIRFLKCFRYPSILCSHRLHSKVFYTGTKSTVDAFLSSATTNCSTVPSLKYPWRCHPVHLEMTLRLALQKSLRVRSSKANLTLVRVLFAIA